MTPPLCPSCNETIGISVAWCAACAAWFRAVKEGVCTVDWPPVAQPQHRDNEGRYDFNGKLERMCVCGCTLGVHAGAAPHDCLAYSMPNEPTYKDCRCPKFRQSRKKPTRSPCAAGNADLC